MEEKTFRLTFDVETDFGGRSQEVTGTRQGLSEILNLLKWYGYKGLFFVSTEALPQLKEEVKRIHKEGHEIGSHGHFHIPYKERWRAEQDRKISETFLLQITGYTHFYYRAPKFHHLRDNCVYSHPSNHVSLLKHIWFGTHIKGDTILYVHPFDIVGGDNPPNLFCKIWYAHHRLAYETFVGLLERGFGDYNCKESVDETTQSVINNGN